MSEAETGQPLNISKSGQKYFSFIFDRSRKGAQGLEIWVKAVPEIEEFIKGLGTGRSDSVEAYNKHWYSPTVQTGDGEVQAPDLRVYDMERYGGQLDGQTWTIQAPGTFMIHQGQINLSFLRLVGISGPNGVRFGIKGPIKQSEADEIITKIGSALRTLVREYIKPFGIELDLVSRDL